MCSEEQSAGSRINNASGTTRERVGKTEAKDRSGTRESLSTCRTSFAHSHEGISRESIISDARGDFTAEHGRSTRREPFRERH